MEKGKSQFAGPEIKGKTLGIIGLGAIGALVANVAIDLGMKVIGTDPFLSVGAALRLSPAVQVAKSADEVLAAADYLTLHVPCNADTKGFINAAAIAKMKDGARVLNFARGELVNDADMIGVCVCAGGVEYYNALLAALVDRDIVYACACSCYCQQVSRKLHLVHGSGAYQDCVRICDIIADGVLALVEQVGAACGDLV